ncbi:VanZ family protein [Leucobacter sp. NPDC015123]|uniref:VanZ family protein n=1 Tax=Leucobacter sp. NPDC015123 TaxID=3364129 RepID=UPI0036F46A5F
MLATFLVEYPWLTPAVLAVFIVASPILTRWLRPRRGLTLGLFLASTVVVLALVLVPTGRDLTAGCLVEWSIPYPKAVEPFANVALFVPPVFLGALLLGRPLLAAACGVAASALIELTQALLPALGRSCSTGDWLANSIGALIGAAIALLGIRLHARRRTYVIRPMETTREPPHN